MDVYKNKKKRFKLMVVLIIVIAVLALIGVFIGMHFHSNSIMKNAKEYLEQNNFAAAQEEMNKLDDDSKEKQELTDEYNFTLSQIFIKLMDEQDYESAYSYIQYFNGEDVQEGAQGLIISMYLMYVQEGLDDTEIVVNHINNSMENLLNDVYQTGSSKDILSYFTGLNEKNDKLKNDIQNLEKFSSQTLPDDFSNIKYLSNKVLNDTYSMGNSVRSKLVNNQTLELEDEGVAIMSNFEELQNELSILQIKYEKEIKMDTSDFLT